MAEHGGKVKVCKMYMSHGDPWSVNMVTCHAGVTQKYLIVTSNYHARRRGVSKLMGISEAKVHRAIVSQYEVDGNTCEAYSSGRTAVEHADVQHADQSPGSTGVSMPSPATVRCAMGRQHSEGCLLWRTASTAIM